MLTACPSVKSMSMKLTAPTALDPVATSILRLFFTKVPSCDMACVFNLLVNLSKLDTLRILCTPPEQALTGNLGVSTVIDCEKKDW